MIYQNFDFSNSFSNASGNRRNGMVISRLAFLIATQPELIKDVLISSNIKVPREVTKNGITKIIVKNRDNEVLIDNLASLLVIESKVNNETRFVNVDGEEKGKFFKKIGDWFRAGKDRREARRLRRQGKEKGKFGEKVGNILKENKGEITEVGGSLLGGLLSRSGRNQLQAQSGQTASGVPINPYAKPPMPLGTKIAIGVGILVIVGIGVYYIRRNK